MKSFLDTIKEAQTITPEKTAEVETSNLAPSKKTPNGKKIMDALTKGRTISGDTPNAIDVNPKYIIRADGIKEATQRTAVFSFGRLNPPTVGHEKLVNAIQAEAKKVGGTPLLFLSRTEGDAKNPLSYSKKNKFAKMAFPIVKDTPKNMMPGGFIGLLKHLEDQYDDVVIVVGSDRLNDVQRLADKYNGKEYKFNNIQVVSAGERDPDAEGVGGMSASKMRQAALDGNLASFKTGLPKRLKGVAKTVFDEVVKSLNEEIEIDEAVLTVSQRLKRRSQMRRSKGRIRLGQRRALARKATSKTISRRSKRIAIKLIRKRILRGRKYQDLSYSGRAAIDRQVARRKSVIVRIAKRVEPKLRQAEGRRKSGQGFKSISLNATPAKKKKLKEEMSRDNLIQVVTEMFSQIAEEVRIPLSAVETATLRRKCNESNNSFETLRTVFDRGVASWYAGLREDSTPQQWGFARVNSFIAGGKTSYTADRDLLEAKDNDGKHEKLSIISNKETNSKQLVGFLKNSDEEIAQAAREALEKRRNAGDKESGVALDSHEEQTPPEQEQEAPQIIAQNPKMTADLAAKMAEILKKGLKESSDTAVGNVPVISQKVVFSEGPLSPIPKTTKPNLFHGNYGGKGNRGGEPVDKLDQAFQKHDTGYHYTPDPEKRLKHDKSLVKATSSIVKDKSQPIKTRVKAGMASALFKTKLALKKKDVKEQTITPKYTGDENSWYHDASGQKVHVFSQADLKHPEDVGKFTKNPTRQKDIGPMMSMQDFLKTQPEKKK